MTFAELWHCRTPFDSWLAWSQDCPTPEGPQHWLPPSSPHPLPQVPAWICPSCQMASCSVLPSGVAAEGLDDCPAGHHMQHVCMATAQNNNCNKFAFQLMMRADRLSMLYVWPCSCVRGKPLASSRWPQQLWHMTCTYRQKFEMGWFTIVATWHMPCMTNVC